MKKLLTFLMMSILAIGVGWAAETVYYTLTPATGSNSNYTSNCDITIDGITWNVTGNAQMVPWRIGGKSISNTDRTVFSKTAMGSAISKVSLDVGAASSITVNSLKLIVASDANFSTIIDEVTATFEANSTINFVPTSGTEWAKNAYYRFTFNVTVSSTSNKFVEFVGATFYTTTGAAKVQKPSFSVPAGHYTSAQEVTISCATTGADIYWGYDGVNFASYDGSSILVNGTMTLYAYAMMSGMDDSEVTSAHYVIETPAQPGDEVTFDYRTGAAFAQENNTTMQQSSKQGITIDFEMGDGSTKPTWYSTENGNARVYKNNTITINAGELVIEKVTFAFEGTTIISNPTLSVGSYADNVWTVGDHSGVLTMNSGASSTRIATITVKLADAGTIVVDAPTISGNESFVGSTLVTITAEDGASIYYTTDNTDPTVESAPYTTPFTINETTTVKAIAAISGTLSGVATKTFTATPSVSTVAAFNDLSDNTVIGFTGELIAVAQTGKFLYAQDTEKGILIYGDIEPTYTLGDVIPGGFTGTKTTFNGAPEMTNPSGLAASTSTRQISPIELTPSQVNLDNFGRYAVIKGATISQDKITVADQQVVLYNRFSLEDSVIPSDGKTYDIIGVCGYYNSAQFMPLSFTEVSATTYPDYYLVGTFNTNGDNWVVDDSRYKFTRTVEGSYYLNDVVLADGVQFKVVKVENGNPAWLGGDYSDNYLVTASDHINMPMNANTGDHNYYMPAGGICDFVISTDQTLTVNKDPQLFMKGSYSNDDWATKSPLTNTETGWTITMDFEAGVEFGFVNEWNSWKGGNGYWIYQNEHEFNGETAPSDMGKELDITSDGNFVMVDAGNYTLTVNQQLTKLVVNVVATPHNVVIDQNIEHGLVTANPSEAVAGTTITLTITPDAGYLLDELTVMAGETPIEVTDDYSFVMPNQDVTVSATFKELVLAQNFKRVTSLQQLEAGKQILIAGVNANEVYVMSDAASNGHNMTALALQSVDNVPPRVINYADGMNVLILGTSGNNYTFAETSSHNYLQATSSTNNYLSVGGLGDNAKAQVSLNNDGTFSIVFQGDYTRNDMRFNINANNSNPLFACYKSDSSMPHVYLYVETDLVEYTITVAECENGSIQEVTAQTAFAGDEVYFTVQPSTNYGVDVVTITTGDGTNVEYENADDIYSFLMPAANVTISATFKQVAWPLEGVTFTADRQWATWYGDQDLTLPQDITAFAVTGIQDDAVTVDPLTYIPANKGVLLYSETASENIVAQPFTDGTDGDITSLLVGSLEAQTVTNGYLLYNNQFILAQEGTTIGAHRCYLPMSAAAHAARVLKIGKPDAVTGVETINSYVNDDNTYYNLLGQPVSHPTPGIYIRGGKKVIVK